MKNLFTILFISLFIFSCDSDSNPMSPVDECGIVNGPGLDCNGDCNENIELWGECYNIQTTQILDLSNSGLTGEIPSEIGNLINLISLKLYNNQLTGELPSEIGNLINLTSLTLYNNQLTGEIPSEIGNLTNLVDLNLRDNQLTGEIPSSIGNLTNLFFLNLSNNQFTGEIPSEICNQGDSTPSVGNNKLCPSYPSCISQDDIDSQDTSNCP